MALWITPEMRLLYPSWSADEIARCVVDGMNAPTKVTPRVIHSLVPRSDEDVYREAFADFVKTYVSRGFVLELLDEGDLKVRMTRREGQTVREMTTGHLRVVDYRPAETEA
jgi:hypothetical protein